MDKGLVEIRHERSVKDFPFLRLEDDEYVEFAFKRSRASLFLILGGLGFGLIVILLAFLFGLIGQQSLDEMGIKFLYIILGSSTAAIVIASIISIFIYQRNRLFITNKHVIQMVMDSPISSSMNMIDLQSVEDVSFHQNYIVEKLFGFGVFRLSTVGDETTYTFKDSDITGDELKAVSRLVTEAKHQKAIDD